MSEHEEDVEQLADLDRSSDCSLSKELPSTTELNFLSQTAPLEPEEDNQHANVIIGHDVPVANQGEHQTGRSGICQSQSTLDNTDKEQSEKDHTDGMLYLCEYCQGPITSSWARKPGFPASQFCSKACAMGKQSTAKATGNDNENNAASSKGSLVSQDESKALDDEMNEEKNLIDETENNETDQSSWKPPVFNWEEYKKILETRAAPLNCFGRLTKEVKGLTAGMKLEALDKNNPCNYCVATVIDVVGHRLRIRYDGFGHDESQDFWANYQAEELFPIGWCAGNSYPLQPPTGITSTLEDWKTFLTKTLTGALAAPTELFRENDKRMQLKVHSFQVGMKVECIHPKKPGIICPATITKSLGPYYYQVTTEALPNLPSHTFYGHCESSGIFPFGWCAKNGVQLTLPAYVDGGGLSKEKYMAMGRSKSAPATSLIKRSAKINRFKVGQKLEAVDLEEPFAIRVATVFSVIGRIILLLFDGQGKFQYVDCESEDIAPTQWCLRTGHPLHTSYGVNPAIVEHSNISEPSTISQFHTDSRRENDCLYTPLTPLDTQDTHHSWSNHNEQYYNDECWHDRCQCPRCNRDQRIRECNACTNTDCRYSTCSSQNNYHGKRRRTTACGRQEQTPKSHPYDRTYHSRSSSTSHRYRDRESDNFTNVNRRYSSDDIGPSSWEKLCFPGYRKGKLASQFIDPNLVLSGNDSYMSRGNNPIPSVSPYAEGVLDDCEEHDNLNQRSNSPNNISNTNYNRDIDPDLVLSGMDTLMALRSLQIPSVTTSNRYTNISNDMALGESSQRRVGLPRSMLCGDTEPNETVYQCSNHSTVENLMKVVDDLRTDVMTSLRRLEGSVRILDRRLDIIEERVTVQNMEGQPSLMDEQGQDPLSKKIKRITRSCQVNISPREPQGRSRTKSSLQLKYSSLKNRKNCRGAPHSSLRRITSTYARNNCQSSPLNTPATYQSPHALPRPPQASSHTLVRLPHSSHNLPRPPRSAVPLQITNSSTVPTSPVMDLTSHSFVSDTTILNPVYTVANIPGLHSSPTMVPVQDNSIRAQLFNSNIFERLAPDPLVQSVYTLNPNQLVSTISANSRSSTDSPIDPPSFTHNAEGLTNARHSTISQHNPLSLMSEVNCHIPNMSVVSSGNQIGINQNLAENRKSTDLFWSVEPSAKSVLEKLTPEQVSGIAALGENQSMKRHEFALRLLDMFFAEEEQVYVSDPTGGCLKNLDRERLRMIKVLTMHYFPISLNSDGSEESSWKHIIQKINTKCRCRRFTHRHRIGTLQLPQSKLN